MLASLRCVTLSTHESNRPWQFRHSEPSVFPIVLSHFRTQRAAVPCVSLWHVTAHPDAEMIPFPPVPLYVVTKLSIASTAVLSRPAKCKVGNPWHCVHKLLSVLSPTERSADVWFSRLTLPARPCRPDHAALYCDAADQLPWASTTWHVRQPESALPLIEPALSHAGVWIPPWQLTFEHFPEDEDGANDGAPPVFDWYAPDTVGIETWYRLLSMCVASVATQSIEEGTYPVWQLAHFATSLTPVEIVYALS